jgi:hypothetical protein
MANEPHDEKDFQREIIRTQNMLVRLLRTYLASVAWLSGIMTVWFILKVTGHL